VSVSGVNPKVDANWVVGYFEWKPRETGFLSKRFKVQEIRVVFRVEVRFALTAYRRVIVASLDVENICPSSLSRYYMLTARNRAIDLLEGLRFRLWLILARSRTGQLGFWMIRKRPWLKPNQGESQKCPFPSRSVEYLNRFREASLYRVCAALSCKLLRRCVWLVLLCLCFWRTRSWARSMLGLKKTVGDNPPIYIEVQSNPLRCRKSDTRDGIWSSITGEEINPESAQPPPQGSKRGP
jgi:hypothetical protein